MSRSTGHDGMSNDITNDLLKALVTATDEQRLEALRILRGKERQENPAIPECEPFLTLKDIGKRLGVSPCSLWRWGVPGHQLGGRRRFRLSEVIAYLDSPAFRQKAEELKRERRT